MTCQDLADFTTSLTDRTHQGDGVDGPWTKLLNQSYNMETESNSIVMVSPFSFLPFPTN
ncbi:hypothetical protein D3C80_2186390 [compost metagenome]